MRYSSRLGALLAGVLIAGGCGGEANRSPDVQGKRPEPAPYVVGLELDDAKRRLDRRGLDYNVHNQGTGPIVVESNWTVCEQWPPSGERDATVELYVEHDCDNGYEDDDDF